MEEGEVGEVGGLPTLDLDIRFELVLIEVRVELAEEEAEVGKAEFEELEEEEVGEEGGEDP